MTAPVVPCPTCAGAATAAKDCRCRWYGDEFLADDGHREREPYRDCELCRGTGSVSHPCGTCGGAGRRRAQLVLTVANLDDGRTASASVVADLLRPERWPNGRYAADLMPMVRELADAVGVVTVPDGAEREVVMPAGWHPDLPEAARLVLAAQALAEDVTFPWWVHLGRSGHPPPRDPDEALRRLCALADLLCLDLVVDARRNHFDGTDGSGLWWSVRLEVPGAPLPQSPYGMHGDIRAAVTAIGPAEALSRVAERDRAAPAYWISPKRTVPDATDLDQLERRVVGACAGVPGATATWREGRWHIGTVRRVGEEETLTEEPTGQVVRRVRPVYGRGYEPPPPSYWLGPVPGDACPACATGTAWERCWCVYGASEPDCAMCGGAGVRANPHDHCFACGGTRRRYLGAVVTVTDLRDRAVHVNWFPADGAPARRVATQPGGKPVMQMAEPLRLLRWAGGVDRAHLTDLVEDLRASGDLLDGLVTLDRPDDDPVTAYLAAVTHGRPAARIMVYADTPAHPPVAALVALALGLDLAFRLTMRSHRRNAGDPLLVQGESWDAEIVPRDAPVDDLAWPVQPSAEAALARCAEYLSGALADAVPGDPDLPIPVPQQPEPPAVDADDLPALLGRVGDHHAGLIVTACVARAGCRVYVDGLLVATAATPRDAVDRLGLATT